MLDDLEVKRLLLRVADKDAVAFERLYQLTGSLMLGIASRIVIRRELAEEVLHEIFIKIWNGAAAGFDPLAERPVAWMTTMVRNRSIDLVSSADVARKQEFDADVNLEEFLDDFFEWSPGPDKALSDEQEKHSLRACLDELKPAERQALALSYMHGLSHGELAERLARPLGTVKAWVRRGLESLRLCVESCMGAR